MFAGDLSTSNSSRRTPRAGIRLDLTPLVDVCMLLLTFFMLTTIFLRPQAMEINRPDGTVDVPASHVLTLRVNSGALLSWTRGEGTESHGLPIPRLRGFLEDQQNAEPLLIVRLQIDRRATYGDMVNVVDELNLARVVRFTLISSDVSTD